MTYAIAQGIEVSLDGNTWYSLTDHNRQPIDITYTLVEQADRMANGTMRKYVVARKFVIKADWKDLATYDPYLVDYWSNSQSITSAVGNGITATYTVVNPPNIGDIAIVKGTGVTGLDGTFTVTGSTSNTFTVTNTHSGTSSIGSMTFSKAKGGSWIKQFYENNNFQPVYVRLNFAQQEPYSQTANTIPSGTYMDSKTVGETHEERTYQAFMTTFTYNVLKRTQGTFITGGVGYDYVDITIEFTEV